MYSPYACAFCGHNTFTYFEMRALIFSTCWDVKAVVPRGLCTKRWRRRKAHCAPEQPHAGARGQHKIENRKIVSNTHSNSPEYCCTCTDDKSPTGSVEIKIIKNYEWAHVEGKWEHRKVCWDSCEPKELLCYFMWNERQVVLPRVSDEFQFCLK